MRKTLLGILGALALSLGMVAGVGAAPSTAKAGPFEGAFAGEVHAANGSSAPLTVEATHRGTTVEGVATLGDGLVVTAGWCGSAAVPASSMELDGTTAPGKPRQLEATRAFDAGGLTVTARFVGEASPDGKSIDGTLIVDVPAFCGPDPVITGSLARVG
jgi:hypothetical protein